MSFLNNSSAFTTFMFAVNACDTCTMFFGTNCLHFAGILILQAISCSFWCVVVKRQNVLECPAWAVSANTLSHRFVDKALALDAFKPDIHMPTNLVGCMNEPWCLFPSFLCHVCRSGHICDERHVLLECSAMSGWRTSFPALIARCSGVMARLSWANHQPLVNTYISVVK